MRVLAGVVVACALGAVPACGRGQAAQEQLEAAKRAYQDALSRTGDFTCAAPEFDEVLRQLDSIPAGTAARREGKRLAGVIREKRGAATTHARALDDETARLAASAAAANVPVATPVAAGGAQAAGQPATDKRSCRTAQRRMIGLKKQRQKDGRPALGTIGFLPNGEVGFAPGAEPTAEERQLARQLRACGGGRADDPEALF